MVDTALVRRAAAYVAAAALFGAVVGFFREGSVGAGIAFGFVVGAGVAIGLVGFEAFRRYA